MIIACPACATRYAVPDSAIGIEGRTVRCAKCRHSWFQEGPQLVEAEGRPAAVAPPPPRPVAAPPPPPPPPPTPPPSEPTYSEPVEEVEGEVVPPPPVAEPAASYGEPVSASYDDTAYSDYDDTESTFAHEPPFKPRRNRMRMWMVAAILFALVAIGAIAAVAWYGLPNWVPLSRTTFAEARPDLVLDFPPNRQDRRTLPNGAEFFGASGSITNIGKVRRSVPVMLIVLRDDRDRVVYSWEVVPSKRQLAPGESVTINEAITDVPKSARVAEIGWKPG